MTPNDYSEDKLIQQSTAEFMEHKLRKALAEYTANESGKKSMLQERLARMIATNGNRVNFYEQLPESYPDESLNLYRNKIYEYISTIYAA